MYMHGQNPVAILFERNQYCSMLVWISIQYYCNTNIKQGYYIILICHFITILIKVCFLLGYNAQTFYKKHFFMMLSILFKVCFLLGYNAQTFYKKHFFMILSILIKVCSLLGYNAQTFYKKHFFMILSILIKVCFLYEAFLLDAFYSY